MGKFFKTAGAQKDFYKLIKSVEHLQDVRKLPDLAIMARGNEMVASKATQLTRKHGLKASQRALKPHMIRGLGILRNPSKTFRQQLNLTQKHIGRELGMPDSSKVLKKALEVSEAIMNVF